MTRLSVCLAGFLVAVTCTAAAALSPNEPYLRWVPAALAVSLIAAFLHQLLRRDGRPRLTESVAASAAGLAVIASGVSYIPLPQTLGGSQTLAVAMAGLGLAALADLAVPSARLRAWALPLAMVIGGLGGMLVSGRITDAAEAAFLKQRLDELEAKLRSSRK